MQEAYMNDKELNLRHCAVICLNHALGHHRYVSRAVCDLGPGRVCGWGWVFGPGSAEFTAPSVYGRDTQSVPGQSRFALSQ